MAEPRVFGVVEKAEGYCELTLRLTGTGRRIAVVRGSGAYIERALLAAGLPPPVDTFAEERDRTGVTFIGSKPANRGAQSPR
ncbi:MAG TPA: hypothetical protein VGK73_06805 [Polyangiaceae bacterium]